MSVTVKWYGAKAKSSAHSGAARGLGKAADYLLEKSQALVPVSPVEGGRLRDSGVASVDDSALRAAVAYTALSVGKYKHYAVRVHERMNDQHAAGQAKYLEQPLNSEKGEILSIIAREIKGKLK